MQEKQLLHHCDIYPFSNIICYYENKTTIYSDENKWTEEYIIMTTYVFVICKVHIEMFCVSINIAKKEWLRVKKISMLRNLKFWL